MKKRKKKSAKPVKLRRVAASAPRAYGNATAAGHGGYTIESKLPKFKDVYEARNTYEDSFPTVYKVTSDDAPSVKQQGDSVQWSVAYGGGFERVLDWKVLNISDNRQEMEAEGLAENGRRFTMKFVPDRDFEDFIDPEDPLTWKPVNMPGGSAGSSGSMLEAQKLDPAGEPINVAITGPKGGPPGRVKTATIEGPDENGKYQFYSPTGKPVFVEPVSRESAKINRLILNRRHGWTFKTHGDL